MRLLNYVKAAFLYHWNLLAFLGASAAALLSGAGDVLLPIVGAAELTYLGLLSTHPRFQAYVDAQQAQLERRATSLSAEQMLQRIRSTLPGELMNRFESLRRQCLELQQIASAVLHGGAANVDAPLEHFQIAGLDRLLWIHLRLLYTQFALSRFLQKTSREQIEEDIQLLERRLEQTPAEAANVQSQKMRKALEDNLETSRARLANLGKARDNFELVKLELDRLENKIRGLSEMAVNRQEPDFISGQVDEVASSMLDTEKTMSELKFATGLADVEDQPPELLQSRTAQFQR